MALFAELRRRNVFKVALLYAIASWLIIWLVGACRAHFTLPVWTGAFTLFILGIGFPVALWFAWTYEITPVGLKKAIDVDQTQSVVYKTGQKLNAAVAVLLVLGVLAMLGQGLLPTFEFFVPPTPQGIAPISARSPAEIRSLVLDNGLEIIVWPDSGNPNVVMHNLVRAGSRNEYPGITGVAHFFERLMFLGTERRAPGEFDRLMAAADAASDTQSSEDVTVFLDRFPRAALETVFDLESDRFENLDIAPEAFEAEREAAYSERRVSIDSNNFWRLYEQVQATAFIAHPYQFPVMGWPSDIEAWTEGDLTRYYRSYYAPNNRTIVVAGGVTPTEVFTLAQKYFAATPAQVPPSPVRTVEPLQTGERRVLVEAPAPAPLVQAAFHIGAAADSDSLAISLLLNILADGDSSRLHQALVAREGAALAVDGYQQEGLDPGLAWFFLTLPPGGDTATAQRLLVAELQRVIEDGISEDELAKAREQLLAEYRASLSTIDGKAAALANYQVFHGNYEKLFLLPERIETITAEHLRAVAAETFRTGNMTVGVLRDPGFSP